jgi:hypothetical protein
VAAANSWPHGYGSVQGVKERAKRDDGAEGVGVEARNGLSRVCDSAIPLSYQTRSHLRETS